MFRPVVGNINTTNGKCTVIVAICQIQSQLIQLKFEHHKPARYTTIYPEVQWLGNIEYYNGFVFLRGWY